MLLIKQTDFSYIADSGCLMMVILTGIQRFLSKSLLLHQIALAYEHLNRQGHIDKDCFVNNHEAVGNLALCLCVAPQYELKYIGKKDLLKNSDTWGTDRDPTFTALHGITDKSGHHFRLGDPEGIQVYDPYSPNPRIVKESSVRYYRIVQRFAK